MSAYDDLKNSLQTTPRTWLVTGVAGFIGSNLLEALLSLNQRVVGLDNLSTGYRENLEEVRKRVQPAQYDQFRMIEGDIADPEVCQGACAGVDIVLHQAAKGSVPAAMSLGS